MLREVGRTCKVSLTLIAARMTWYELCYIPYYIIYDYPAVLFSGMLLDLFHGNGIVCHFGTLSQERLTTQSC